MADWLSWATSATSYQPNQVFYTQLYNYNAWGQPAVIKKSNPIKDVKEIEL